MRKDDQLGSSEAPRTMRSMIKVSRMIKSHGCIGPTHVTSVTDLLTVFSSFRTTVFKLVFNDYGTIWKTYEVEPPTREF